MLLDADTIGHKLRQRADCKQQCNVACARPFCSQAFPLCSQSIQGACLGLLPSSPQPRDPPYGYTHSTDELSDPRAVSHSDLSIETFPAYQPSVAPLFGICSSAIQANLNTAPHREGCGNKVVLVSQ
eukprot:3543450-Amphidinium_carterae.1